MSTANGSGQKSGTIANGSAARNSFLPSNKVDPFDDVKLGQLVGTGSYGRVYRGASVCVCVCACVVRLCVRVWTSVIVSSLGSWRAQDKTWLYVSRCECVYVLACLCVLDFCDGVELGQLVGTGLYMALCIEVQCPGGG